MCRCMSIRYFYSDQYYCKFTVNDFLTKKVKIGVVSLLNDM